MLAISLTFIVACCLVHAEGQNYNALSYTILKLHTFKTETESCKNEYAVTRFNAKTNTSLDFKLAPNCTFCQNLNLQQHLVRIHKSIMLFVQPIIDVYAFEINGPYNQLKTCVRNVQHVLYTLKALAEIQIPPITASKHQPASTDSLKAITRNYLKSLPQYANKQPSDDEIMSEFSVALLKELYVTAVVLQKDRAAMQRFTSSATQSNQVI
eukprot:gene6169-6880_t